MGTDIVMVLDRSGSMAGQIGNVIEHFNEYVEEMSLIEGVTLTTIIFDDEINVLYTRVPISTVSPLTRETFFARGSTALNDALGKGISILDSFADKQRIIVVVNTDGLENASHEYSTQGIKDLVAEKQTADWQFVFVGAGIDAFGVGTGYGFSGYNSYTVTQDSSGIADSYTTVLAASAGYASGASGSVNMTQTSATMDSAFSEPIKDDDSVDVKISKRAAQRRNSARSKT